MKVLRSDKKGLTLVEVLISAVILGIVFISLLGVFVVGRFGSAKAKHHIEAMNHARAAMEQYIKDGTTITYTITTGDISSLNGNCVIGKTENYGDDDGLTRVVVTISWTPPTWGGGKKVSEELVTLIRE